VIGRYISPRFLAVAAGIVAAAIGGFFIARALTRPETIEVPLPAKVVRVREVERVEVPVPGAPRIVELVRWQTERVEVPVEVIREVVRQAETGPPPEARVRVEAEQLAGVEGGLAVRGWRGWATCEIRLGEAWTELAHAPLDLEASEAVSVEGAFAVPALPLNRLDLGAALTADGVGWLAGYSRRLSWRTRAGQAILPDWIGGDVLALPETTAILARVSWEW